MPSSFLSLSVCMLAFFTWHVMQWKGTCSAHALQYTENNNQKHYARDVCRSVFSRILCRESFKTPPSSSNSDVNHACVLTPLQMKCSVRRRLSLSERDHHIESDGMSRASNERHKVTSLDTCTGCMALRCTPTASLPMLLCCATKLCHCIAEPRSHIAHSRYAHMLDIMLAFCSIQYVSCLFTITAWKKSWGTYSTWTM